ncbi:MAG: sigma-70 family RNA polymerase sigma factor [bacterium]|nr:sigma-70 family RNA polymerase sigma factor [bacterium]
MQQVTDSADATSDIPALVAAAQRGEEAAFSQLYREFGRVVHGILLARCGPDAADDLTQELFMRAFQRLSELQDPAAFPGWLCTAARNASVDHLRAAQRRPQPSELPDIATEAPAPDDRLAQQEAARSVLACIAKLSATYRETLVLRLVEGLTGPEIAARTGMTHGSVRVNLTRGMSQLRPLLTEAGLP